MSDPVFSLDSAATLRQMNFIRALSREAGLNEEMTNVEAERIYGKLVRQLTRREASEFIDHMQTIKPWRDVQ